MHMSLIDGPGRAGRCHAPRWVALLMVVGLVACKTQLPEEHVPSSPSLYLELASLNGEAVSKARVRLSSGEERQVTEQGTVLLDNLSVGHHALQVRAEGFSQTVLAFDMGQDIRAGARLKLLPLGEPQLFDASRGDTLPVGDMQLTIPAGALRDAQGNPIQGQVEAYLSALDLENGELLAAPGVLEGVPVPDAEPVGLESLGMVSIVFQQKGQVIPFARGTHLGGNVPGRPGSAGSPDGRSGTRRGELSSTSTSRPAPIWRLEAASGRWVPTGDMAVVTGSRWEVTLNNTPALLNVALPFWSRTPEASTDNPLQAPTPWWVGTSCLEVKVEDDKGQPVAGRMVVAQGKEYKGLTRAMTGADGRVRLEVMKGQLVDVDAGEQAVQKYTGSTARRCSGEGVPSESVTLTVAAPLCTPGTALDCAYSGPTQGLCRAARQTCDAQGSAWSTCAGEVGPQRERCDNAEDDDCDGTINESCERLCQQGETRTCEGLEDIHGVGLCRAGTKTCVAGGTAWSVCEGQVLPAQEDYTRPEDEDCDGLEGLCLPGETQPCYSGPEGTMNVGICHAGTKTCTDTGTNWGPCTGEVTPQTESCASAWDEDCDGHVNEAPPCSWVATPDMPSARAHHATVVLDDGKVLVMGGVGVSNEALDTAAEYDPANKTWTTVGSMSVQRKNFAAVRLNDGTVLVMGGKDDSNYLASAEVYDPVNKNWTTVTSVGAMATARDSHTATLLSNGQVLVTGGYGLGGTPLATAEVYDPVNKNWTTMIPPAMGTPRALHTATRLTNGKVLVIGGKSDATTSLASAEVYDPSGRTWTPVSGMNGGPRFVHTATLLSDGQVLVAGGFRNGANVMTTEVYDPTRNEWTSVGSLNTVRDEHTAVLLSTGHVLVAGGDNSSTATATAEMYDPAAKTWTAVAPMTAARSAHTLVVLGTDEVFVIGGRSTSNSGSLLSTEVYNPAEPAAASTWMPTVLRNTP